MPKASSKSSNKKPKSSTSKVSSFFTVLSNLFTIGITAATSSTVALASDAANTATEYTVKPFNSLVKSATQRYFAPQITYSSYSVRWGLPGTGRKRSATEEVVFARSDGNGLTRRNSLARPQGNVATGLTRPGGPPRSSSVPVLTALDVPDLAHRRRRPTLLPINTNVPRISFPRSDTSPSPLSASSFSTLAEAGGSGLPTPMLSASYSSTSESGSSMPSTPRLGSSPRQASPLSQAQSISLVSVVEPSSPVEVPKYSKSLPIARFSFWNLVGLNEGGKEEVSSIQGENEDQLRTPHENEEDAHEEEPESYKRLCYI